MSRLSRVRILVIAAYLIGVGAGLAQGVPDGLRPWVIGFYTALGCVIGWKLEWAAE